MNDESDFQRVLGPFSTVCVVIGAIIGIGIFFNPADVAKIIAIAKAAEPKLRILVRNVLRSEAEALPASA